MQARGLATSPRFDCRESLSPAAVIVVDRHRYRPVQVRRPRARDVADVTSLGCGVTRNRVMRVDDVRFSPRVDLDVWEHHRPPPFIKIKWPQEELRLKVLCCRVDNWAPCHSVVR